MFVTKSDGIDTDGEPEMLKFWAIYDSSMGDDVTPDDAPAAPYLLGFVPRAFEVSTTREMSIHLPGRGNMYSVAYYEGIDIFSVVARAAGMNPEEFILTAATPPDSPEREYYMIEKHLTKMLRPGFHIYAVKKHNTDSTRDVVLVKTLTGAYTIPVVKNMMVYELKIAIQDQTGIPPDQQRLISAGRQLEDYWTLEECCGDKISECTIHLVLKLRGGMYHVTSGRSDLSDLNPTAAAAINTSGKLPLEVVFPDCSTLLMGVREDEDPKTLKYRLAAILAKRDAERLAAELAELQNSSAGYQSVGGMQNALRRVQAYLQGWGSTR